ncbi:MAG: M20 family metallopeptidase [Bacteroidales bacterium]|nr:M20 family metallopeptidase [Bacteroidales bacterium]
MLSKETIRAAAETLYDQTVAMRRHLHSHPELSFKETATGAYVAERLRHLNIPIKTGFATGPGIVGLIEGGRPGRTIALRADMDALPICEAKSHAVRSQNEGVMHACGHDLHTASLLTVAQILQENRAELAGRYILVFQPGEESWPGGASLMLKDGALEAFGYKPDAVIGAHVLAEMATGHAGFRPGTYMASGDEIHIHINGRGGHGGMPHQLTDTVLIGCETVVAMQHLVAREVPATIPMVLSFGKFEADGATNVIPNTVYIAGTMRTMDETWRARTLERIEQVADGVAKTFGARAEVEIRHGYPSVCNDAALTARAKALTAEMLGSENVEEMPLRMTAEDFGYYTQRYPSVFYRFGVSSAAGAHTPDFEPDEESLRTAPAVMAWMAINMAEG